MTLDLFAIYDTKAEAYMTPFYLQNDKMALRVFADCCNDPDHTFGRNPEDYILFKLGQFNVQTGKHEMLRAATSVSNGISTLRHELKVVGGTEDGN